MYQTATPNLSAAEGIDLILESATNSVQYEPVTEYERGVRDGVVDALESLLSSNEPPARAILDSRTEPVFLLPEEEKAWELEQEARKQDYVVVETVYGGHDKSIETYGPYTIAQAMGKLARLTADWPNDDDHDVEPMFASSGGGTVEIQICSLTK